MAEIKINQGMESPEMISQKTKDILSMAGDKSNNPVITMNSGIRSPKRQVLAMYTNLVNKKTINYAAPGREVIKVYNDNKSKDKAIVIDLMVKKVEELSLQGKRVSRHCVTKEQYEKCNIVDISKHIPNPRDLVCALMEWDEVVKVITPFSSPKYVKWKDRIMVDVHEPCIHIEINQ